MIALGLLAIVGAALLTVLLMTTILAGSALLAHGAGEHARDLAADIETETQRLATIIDNLLALSRRRYVSPGHLAFAYIGLGDRDRAFEWLERAYEERSNMMMYFGAARPDPLRDDPRHARLVAKVRAQHSVRTAALPVKPTS